MKFKYSVSPNYHTNVDTKRMMNDVSLALLFVSVCCIILQYTLYGIAGSLRALLIMVVSVITCMLVDFIFWKVKKITNDKIKDKIQQNVPLITGLILALTLPLGDLASYKIIYVTIVAAIIAELVGKLFFGGFGYNIFNPAAVGRAFILLAFGQYLIAPQVDGLASATPLQSLQQNVGNMSEVFKSFDGLTSLLFGTHAGSIGETMVIPLLIAGVYLVARKVIDWIIPVFAILTVGILAAVYSMVAGGFDADFVLVHMLSGGLIFGAVFMLTDPVTNPISNQAKMIYAIVFALVTFLIRAKANLPEGVVFAILLANMIVPFLDSACAGLTNKFAGKKTLSVIGILLLAIILTILFYYV